MGGPVKNTLYEVSLKKTLFKLIFAKIFSLISWNSEHFRQQILPTIQLTLAFSFSLKWNYFLYFFFLLQMMKRNIYFPPGASKDVHWQRDFNTWGETNNSSHWLNHRIPGGLILSPYSIFSFNIWCPIGRIWTRAGFTRTDFDPILWHSNLKIQRLILKIQTLWHFSTI